MKKKNIPRSKDNDYTNEMAEERRAFIKENAGKDLKHMNNYSFDPDILQGNIESFFGVAQVPVGIAGPLLVNGEHAKGEFYIPMATTEGTLLASYNRGMKVIKECGGVNTTICGDAMQRSPVFIFDNARDARDFSDWIDENFLEIKKHAESSTSIGKLSDIERYIVSKMVYTRFNYTTGDAAGQNMTNRATYVACEWIRSKCPAMKTYSLSANFETDKKASGINLLRTRGKRVTAELTIPKDVAEKILRIDPKRLQFGHMISNMGSFMANAANNAAHVANGLTAIFIATGQDVANVTESHSAISYQHETKDGAYYFSITLPSLIVATYGGGTGLATQKEGLEIMDCYGKDRVMKFAEIVAGVVLAGELSLIAAVRIDKETRKSDWVDAHESLGRNR